MQKDYFLFLPLFWYPRYKRGENHCLILLQVDCNFFFIKFDQNFSGAIEKPNSSQVVQDKNATESSVDQGKVVNQKKDDGKGKHAC